MDHRADIYSLGVVFYEMLTGELPLGKFAPPSRKVQVDVRLDEVVLHALEKEPELRYQQASQVKTAVETIVASGSNAGVPPAGADATCGRAERELKRGGIVLVGRRNGQRVIVWSGVANTFFAILGCGTYHHVGFMVLHADRNRAVHFRHIAGSADHSRWRDHGVQDSVSTASAP